MATDTRPYCTCVLTRRDAQSVYRLRAQEYAAAAEFDMTQPERLQWNAYDEQGIVIGVWHANQLVSTLRALVIPERAVAEDVFACTVDLQPEMFPALAFGRGATHAAFQRRGLNALLRLYFFLALQPDDFIRSSLALPYQGAPRINLLKKLGYELNQPKQSWDDEAREKTPALLAVLPRHRIASARALLTSLTIPNIERYPWSGIPLSIDKGNTNHPGYRRRT